MSAGKFRRSIISNIIRRLESSSKTKRGESQKLPTVLEVNPSILLRNIEGMPAHKVKDVTKTLIEAIHATRPNMQRFDPETSPDPVKGSKVSYMGSGNELVLIGPSYKAIRAILSTASRNLTKSKNPYSELIGSVYETRNITRSSGEVEPKTQWWSRLDLGHTADSEQDNGRETVGSERIVEAFRAKPVTIANTNLMVRFLNRINDIHAPYKAEYTKTIKKTGESFANFKFVYVVPQSHTLNNKLSIEETKIMKELGTALVETRTSPPFIQMVVNKVLSLFQDVPYKTGTSKSSAKGEMRIKRKKRKANITVPSGPKIRDAKGRFSSTINIMALLNARLHDQIRLNMGKGSARQILNYQTGRFAGSARVQSVTQQGDSVIANYTFMRSPYDVFMPGGRLYKPGRNPEKIINRSIRQLATQLLNSKFKLKPNLMEGL